MPSFPMLSHPLLALHPVPLTPAAKLALHQTNAREQSLAKPAGALGKLEHITTHLATWQEQAPPSLDTVHTLVFAGKHGICKENISAYPASVTEQMVATFRNNGAAVNQLCNLAKSSLSVHPVNFSSTTENFLHQPAMTEKNCTKAFQQGVDAVQPCNLLVIGEMGIGNTTSAAAMLTALYNPSGEGTSDEWVSSGTSLDRKELQHKKQVVEQAVRRFNDKHPLLSSPVEQGWSVLCELGGFELAAIVGALLQARALRIPVLLDGYPCCAAAAVAQRLNRQALENCLIAHLPQQQGAASLHKKLECGEPLLQLDMRLGEASGAVLAILLVRAALACHTGMHSFEQAGVDRAL